MNPFPLILSAPSGGGKTTIAQQLLAQREDVGYSVSCTTRQPRKGEVDGRDYHFLTREAFQAALQRGEFAEFAEVHGEMYGTLRREVERVLDGRQHVIMDIDVQGAQQFLAAFPESVLIFILPPSGDALLDRLRSRRTESQSSLRRRLESALEELRAVQMYQYVLVNDDLDRSVNVVSAIIDAETVRHGRLERLEAQVAALVERLEREVEQLPQTV